MIIIIIIAVIYSTGKEVSFNGHIIVFFHSKAKVRITLPGFIVSVAPWLEGFNWCKS